MKRLRYTKSELDACVAGQRELLATWMIENGFATGHGDTLADLLRELTWQIKELRTLARLDM